MIISELIQKYNLSVLLNTCNEKDYSFTCVLDRALELKKDFIYLPFTSKKELVFDFIEKALKNPHCKGFIINTAWAESAQLKPKVNDIILKCSQNLELVALARNIYNLAYSLSRENCKKYKLKVASIVGFEDLTTVKDILVSSMGDKSYISYAENSWDVWQKSVEPILSADENTNWAILEVIPSKRYLLENVGKYLKNHVIFTKISLNFMNIWGDFDVLSDELLKLFSEGKNLVSIYNCDTNEIIERKITGEFQDRYFVVKSVNTFEQERQNRCFALAAKFLQDIGAEPISAEEFIKQDDFYDEHSINGKNVFQIKKDEICFNSVKEALGVFFNKYEANKSVVILEHITGLGDYKENAYCELLSSLAKYNPNILILVDTKAYIHFFKRENRTTYVKYFAYNPDDIKIFLDGLSDDYSSIFTASLKDLPFLECEAEK